MNAESNGGGRSVPVDTTDGAATGPGDNPVEGTGEVAKEPGPRISKAPKFIQARRSLHLSWQVGVFVVGLAIVALGVVMLPLPGPGWVVIFLGMAVWATEFVWAQVVLHWTKRKVTEAAQRALDPKVRRRNITLTAIGCVIAGALLAAYVAKYGFEMPWNIER
ncbi:TIGR02611 family protein [Streptomyces sp. NPDC051940]|uniref:TIGR02611 family protein n=1 Tax=Streptomyces sp. NPDC051940 TaxID=3155675 RepID=UPI00342AFFE2